MTKVEMSARLERLQLHRQLSQYIGEDGVLRDGPAEQCAWRCHGTFDSWSCKRRSGHGTEGAYCKQHARIDDALGDEMTATAALEEPRNVRMRRVFRVEFCFKTGLPATDRLYLVCGHDKEIPAFSGHKPGDRVPCLLCGEKRREAHEVTHFDSIEVVAPRPNPRKRRRLFKGDL